MYCNYSQTDTHKTEIPKLIGQNKIYKDIYDYSRINIRTNYVVYSAK